MSKNNFLLIFAFFLISFSSIAQERTSSIEEMRRNAISFNFLGSTPLLGITYDRIVSEKVSIEIGAGIPSVGAGFKYYPWNIKESKVLFHVGLSTSFIFTEPYDVWGTSDKTGVFMGYLPIGISYFGKNGFNLGIDLGPSVAAKVIPYGNLKLGYRF